MNELSTKVYAYRLKLTDGVTVNLSKEEGDKIKLYRRDWLENKKNKAMTIKNHEYTMYHIEDIVDLIAENQRLIKEGEEFFKKFNPVDEETEQNKWWCLNIAKPALSLILKHGNIENALYEDKTGVVKQYLEDSTKNLTKEKEAGIKVVQNAEVIKN